MTEATDDRHSILGTQAVLVPVQRCPWVETAARFQTAPTPIA